MILPVIRQMMTLENCHHDTILSYPTSTILCFQSTHDRYETITLDFLYITESIYNSLNGLDICDRTNLSIYFAYSFNICHVVQVHSSPEPASPQSWYLHILSHPVTPSKDRLHVSLKDGIGHGSLGISWCASVLAFFFSLCGRISVRTVTKICPKIQMWAYSLPRTIIRTLNVN